MARYKAGEKEQARERMLEAAGRRLRRSGFHGVGIDGLMAEAGLTSGAFYSNFGSKEGLLEAVLDRAIDPDAVEAAPAKAPTGGLKHSLSRLFFFSCLV
ncbi:TetR/AcrR family transcriptional regulator, partial [bacterium]